MFTYLKKIESTKITEKKNYNSVFSKMNNESRMLLFFYQEKKNKYIVIYRFAIDIFLH